MVQARQRLGDDPVKQVFNKAADNMYHTEEFDTWAGVNLLAVDGVVWRTADSDENRGAFHRLATNMGYRIPQMGLSYGTHYYPISSEFDNYKTNEMKLAERLIERTPNHSLTMFDKGYYSLVC